MAEEEVSGEVKKLVIERLKRMPPNYRILVGSSGKTYGREDMISSVEKEDELGMRIVRMQLNYLRSFKRKVEAHG